MVVKYNNSVLKIEVNVNPAEEIDFKYHRKLDCIKITAFSPDAHFLQFVTRQYPDLYEYNQSHGNIIRWDPVEQHYMSDLMHPSWKLDVTKDSNSCFYDEGGLNCKCSDSISIYDDPTGIFITKEERSVFCTFILIGNDIPYLIKWSNQVTIEDIEERCYTVEVIKWNKPLPLWAIKILNNHYECKKSGLPLTLALPELVAQAKAMTNEDFNQNSREFFLQPPDNWITKLKFPVFFSDFSIEKHEPVLTSRRSPSPAR